MNKYSFGVLLILLSFSIYGQDKSSNNDLRIKKEIFTIQEFEGKHIKLYRLESSINGQFNILIKRKKKILSNKKVDTEDAQKIDEDFVDKFISMKYIMKSRKGESCKNAFHLSLRGEGQMICQDEKEKIMKIKTFLANLKNNFS